MTIRRQFLKWDWHGDLHLIEEKGKKIDIISESAFSNELMIFDTFPFIMPIETPGWIQLKIDNSEIFGRYGKDKGIPTEWLYELRNKKNILGLKEKRVILTNREYLWEKLYVAGRKPYVWYFEFGEEIVRHSIDYPDDDKYRNLFKKKKGVTKRKRVIKFIAEINKIKIIIPYISYSGADGIVANRLLDAGISITPEKVLDIRKNPHTKTWNQYKATYE